MGCWGTMLEMPAAGTGSGGEGQLIAACREGDREAFRQLFELHQRRVWSIAFHFIGEEAGARDITQQVFLKLFTTIGQFRSDASFSTWLYRLVANACLDEQRRRRRFLSFDFFRPSVRERGSAPSHEETFVQGEITEGIQTAVRELSPKLRLPILLRYFEGMSYEEMARVLECSPGTVASRLNRGHKVLAGKLAHLRAGGKE